ncbi:MAG: hypothetical protein EB023_07845 [Flavobacteriia bacterium]|nr:hypothetical protein [Flavobacteriia bacterium]
MARPIYSFIDPNSGLRYFQIWDTYTGHAHTVPMDFLTFLQHEGVDNQMVVRVLYMFYDLLLQNGCTMAHDAFSKLSKTYQNQSYEFVLKYADAPDADGLNKIKHLEKLFDGNLGYFEVWSAYQEIMKDAPTKTSRRKKYYLSWNSLICLSPNYEQPLRKALKNHALTQSLNPQFDSWMGDITSWIDHGKIAMHREFFSDFFYEMAVSYEIPMVTIPHVLRSEPKIIALFEDNHMVDFLPDTVVYPSNARGFTKAWSVVEYDIIDDHDDVGPFQIISINGDEKSTEDPWLMFVTNPVSETFLIRKFSYEINSMLFHEYDVANSPSLGVDLYRQIITSSQSEIAWIACNLNLVEINISNTTVKTDIKKGFRNKPIFLNETMLRSPLCHHAIFIKTDTHAIRMFYEKSCSAESFIQLALSLIGDLTQAGLFSILEFQDYLHSKLQTENFTPLPCFNQKLDVANIESLLNIKLNAQGKFDKPEEDPDELPF